MTDFKPAGFGPYSVIGPHQGLRVTFAHTGVWGVPDNIEESNFRDTVAALVDNISEREIAFRPASDVTVAPGELAATIDFAVVTPGSLSVAQALDAIQDAMYAPWVLLRPTYIRQVELLDGDEWGTMIPAPAPDEEKNPLAFLAVWGGVLLVAGGVVFFAPEIKSALRVTRRVVP